MAGDAAFEQDVYGNTNNNEALLSSYAATDDASSIVVTTTRSAEITQVQFVSGIILTVLAGLLTVYMLMEIQRHYNNSYNRFDFENESSETTSNTTARNELELESNLEDNDGKSSSFVSSPRLKRPLAWYQKLYIFVSVGTLILVNYLLLVFLPASISLSVLAAFLVWCITLHQVLIEEVCRRNRIDRVLVILTCFLVTAAALSLATYAKMTQNEGTLYKGPARIIGYNQDNYANAKGQSAIRTDLIVSFGGDWACPENPAECQAQVQGVLCHDKTQNPDQQQQSSTSGEEEDWSSNTISTTTAAEQSSTNNNNGGRRRRGLVDQDQSSSGTDTSTGVNNSTTSSSQDDLVTKNQELENEVEQEKEENEELEQDLEDEEAANNNNDGGGDDNYYYYYYYGNYSFDDASFDDGYWSNYDWSSLWGEYACGDLFTTDLEQMEAYDFTTMPGTDSWPYVTIYGSCNSCNAYLVDYFSSEHFASIQTFLTHSRYYGVAAAVVGLLALIAVVKQRLTPSHEKEIELLSYGETTGGGISSSTTKSSGERPTSPGNDTFVSLSLN